MSFMETLIEEIRKAVDSKETTMSHLASVAGCSRQHIYAVLDGKSQMSIAVAQKLAAAIDCELMVKKRSRKKSLISVN